jgi:hypothetical protein
MEDQNVEKEFYSIDEVEKIVGKNRGTVYNRIKLLDIKKHKFPQDSRTYIAAKDVERMKIVIQKPWMAEELKKGRPEISEAA